tara:strand:- start:60 stop:317 length:258 start_codon:yes stop_codon:yes gene_type:complete
MGHEFFVSFSQPSIGIIAFFFSFVKKIRREGKRKLTAFSAEGIDSCFAQQRGGLVVVARGTPAFEVFDKLLPGGAIDLVNTGKHL